MRNATEEASPGSADPQADQESLGQYLARAGRLPILQGFALAVQLLADLDASHRRGLAPGDLSISTLRISRTGRLLVASAAGAPAQDHSQPRRPTEAEIARDLDSAAAVVYELLTGTRPANPHKTALPVRARRAELPSELDAVFARALAARPETRYRSAAEFSAALQAAMPQPRWERSVLPARAVRAELPAQSPPSETVRAPVFPSASAVPAKTRSRRRFGLAVAGGAAIGMLAVALWTGLGPASQSEVQEPRAAAPLQETVVERTEPAAHVAAAPSIAPTGSAAPLERGIASPQQRKAAAPAPKVAAREGRSAARRAVASHRSVDSRVVRVVHSLPPGPEAACHQDFAIAREACIAFRCATSEFRHHPVCVRMHAEGARARAQLAESRGGP
ncbi:hypothetical protein ACPWT1_00090 [Ramlibacter sp. MMS24-I3-19]|uniref:hypothetical protein n=1 Tax=Ramlibacter sp. MMS24-I3-19 TaxID=3416606 RepID=UPI003CFC5041